jgi:membrane peptidoglycan carboxypeptidase
LAGLPQRPSVYSPFSSRMTDEEQPFWQLRTRAVLQRMREDGYINSEQYDEAVETIADLTFDKGTLEIKAPHFVFYAKDQLTEMFGEALVEAGGLTVITSLDLPLHEKAQEIVAEEIEAVEHLHITNGSAMIMDPRTGEILSMVGSRNFFDNEKGGQFNVAADGLRQPGSSIKPVTYLGLLQKGYTPAYMLVDAPTDFRRNDNEKPYTPRNYTGTFQGPISVRKSLGNSLNVPAVKALALVGVEDFLQLAYDLGFETLEPTQENLDRFGLALTLGGGEVRLVDLVSAYSAFANSGTKVEPVAILKVIDRDGRVLYEHRPVEGKRVMSKGEAFLINHILADDSARAIAFGTNSFLNLGPDVAVKTGTTNDMIDNWTVGWSQEVIVGTWVGNNDNSSMLQVASGTTGASPIWRKIILAAFEAGYEAPPWQVPEDEVEQVEVDAISGYPVHDDFAGRMEYVIKKTLPPLPDPIHKNEKVCKGENKLATEAMIARGDYDKREVIDLRREDPLSTDGVNRWMEGIYKWIESQDDSRYSIPTEYCGDVEDVSVRLERPKDKEEFDDENIEVRINAGSDVGIEKIELWVNGSKRETIESSYYEGKIRLSAGQHELFAKAFSREGKEAESGKVRIGTGGEPWEKPEPTATPEPTSTPTIAPTATPTSTLTPTPEPTEEPAPTITPEPEEE